MKVDQVFALLLNLNDDSRPRHCLLWQVCSCVSDSAHVKMAKPWPVSVMAGFCLCFIQCPCKEDRARSVSVMAGVCWCFRQCPCKEDRARVCACYGMCLLVSDSAHVKRTEPGLCLLWQVYACVSDSAPVKRTEPGSVPVMAGVCLCFRQCPEAGGILHGCW